MNAGNVQVSTRPDPDEGLDPVEVAEIGKEFEARSQDRAGVVAVAGILDLVDTETSPRNELESVGDGEVEGTAQYAGIRLRLHIVVDFSPLPVELRPHGEVPVDVHSAEAAQTVAGPLVVVGQRCPHTAVRIEVGGVRRNRGGDGT